MAPHSSTLAWKIPWMEEPGRLQSMGSLRVGHDWATSLSLFIFMHWRRKWQPTPVFLPGEPRDGDAWWAAVYGVAQSRTRLKWLSSSHRGIALQEIIELHIFDLWSFVYALYFTIKKATNSRLLLSFKSHSITYLLATPTSSWTARRSNHSILKEINPEYSLKVLMMKLKLQYFGHLMQRADSLVKTLMLGNIEGSRSRGQKKMR